MCHFTFVIRSINECCSSCFQVKQRSCASLIINDQHELDFKVATTLLLLGFMRFCRLCVICKSRSKRKVRRSIAFLSKRRGDHLNSTEIQACLWRNRKIGNVSCCFIVMMTKSKCSLHIDCNFVVKLFL